MRPTRLISYLLGTLFLSSACATIPLLPPEIPAPGEILGQVDARQQALRGLKGLARVRVSSSEKNYSAQQVLLINRPGFLRVESLSPLGTPLFYLVTDGREVNLYHPEQNQYYHGPFRTSFLAFALPVALNAEEVVAFLLGGPLPMAYEKIALRADREEGLWVLDLFSPSREEHQTLWVHPQSFHILRGEFKRPQGSYHFAFAGFRLLQGILFPERLQLSSLNPRAEVSVEFQEAELNPPWEVRHFHLPVPPGATLIPWP